MEILLDLFIMSLEEISPDEIVKVEIGTGEPILYSYSTNLISKDRFIVLLPTLLFLNFFNFSD